MTIQVVKHRPSASRFDERALTKSIGQSLLRDRFFLRGRLKRLGDDARAGRDVATALEDLTRRIENSLQQVEMRRAAVPVLNYPEELPVSARCEEIVAAIRDHPVLIVCGETGSGKTTQLPKLCLEAGRGVFGMIGHTQPRRLAARTVAARIAEELGQPLGKAVGYKIRFQDTTAPGALVKLMTDGILLAETQTDRFLNAYDTLIVDEAHERGLNIDFLLGYLKWLLPRRPELKIVITSATIDPERFSRHFDNAPILNVSGRTYPVEMRYRPVEGEEGDETERTLQQAILEAADELFRDQSGDILLFLSGEREIRETAESLRKHHPERCEILPLYSRLSFGEQEKVFKSHDRRRIVLATNVAETSLTVPGIRAVIDAGYARISRYSHRGKLQRLPVEKIAQASANQRAGRCGRVGPGICIRLYSEEDFLARPEFTEPEILRTNLAAVILQMQALKLGEIEDFPFLEAPDDKLIRDGQKTLQELNALDAQGKLTPLGHKLARLPLDPRLGAMLLAAEKNRCLTEVAIIVAALGVQDPRERPLEYAQAADQKHALFKHEQSDFLAFLNLWNAYQEQKKHLSNSKLRAWCREHFLSYLRVREWEDIHRQLSQLICGELALKPNEVPAEYGEIHRALLTGLLTQVAFKNEQNEYVGARNVKLQIHPGSHQAKAKPKWIVCAEQVETSRVFARTVAKIEPEWIEQCGAHLIKRHHYDPHWERKAARVAAFERVTLYGLTIRAGHKVAYERINPVEAREIFIREALVQQDFDCRAAFFEHNQKVLESADYLQQKGRRVDLVVDEAWLYAFYDARIPPEVCSGVSFDKWRREAERADPDLLKLTREEVTRQEDTRLDAVNFPDHLDVNGVAVKLEYRFMPGDPEDGVSAVVPLHQLNQLAIAPFTWLVPGLLRDKVIALIKTLPKPTRRHFVPVPDCAERCLPLLGEDRSQPLSRALGLALDKTHGVRIPADEWNEAAVSEHLRMNFRLLDEKGKILASERDLSGLQKRFGQDAVRQFAAKAARQFQKTGCTSWDFGEIPARYDQDGLAGFPALVDEGESVGLQLFDTEKEATARHRGGLTRLIALTMGKDVKYLRKNLPVSAGQELDYARLPVGWAPPTSGARAGNGGRCPPYGDSATSLRDDLVSLSLQSLYFDDQPDIRSEAAFRRRLDKPPAPLLEHAHSVGKLAAEILDAHAALRKKLAGWPEKDATGRDAREQLDRLVYAGFLRLTPYSRLKEYPRYFKALAHRLEKALQDRGRDARSLDTLKPFWDPYWQAVRGKNIRCEEDEFRWLLEEFRVSLFAQQIKTACPVSAKRLEEAWKKRGG